MRDYVGEYLSTYQLLGLLLLLGAAFFTVAFTANRLLSRRAPSVSKNSS
ncbi:MAG: hypothetical protein H0T78_00660, partial [Longispora sp.]|nr:hypothetical protein [Longispora sp. (in: high G+C Gram-positive bacteria)]